MRYKNCLFALSFFVVLAGCKKSDAIITHLASLSITNVVVGGKNVKLNSNIVDSAVNFNYKQFGLLAGNTNVYVYPTGDSSHPYYNKTIQASTGGVYSLFLAGSTSTQVDTILIKESISVYTDSSSGVRFINLSYNSGPIIVTQSATPTVIDFTSLAYKQISAFKTYPALSTNGTYSFQIRDAVSNLVLATYVLATPRFNNCTLVWKGMVGGTGANVLGILKANNY